MQRRKRAEAQSAETQNASPEAIDVCYETDRSLFILHFPDDELSTEGLFVAQCIRIALPIATKLNILTIVAMFVTMFLEQEFRNIALVIAAANVVGLFVDSYYIMLLEQRHGSLFAHRFLVRTSAAIMLAVFIVAIPMVLWQQGLLLHFIGQSPWPLERLGACSPLLCVACAGISAMMASVFELIVSPLPYILAVDMSVITFAFMLPPYTPLGHSNEVLITVMGVVFGDLVGRALQRGMWLAFTTGLADKQNLRRRLKDIDAEKEHMLARLEQIDAEKDRLMYDLLFAQQRSAAPRPATTSSCETDSEIAQLQSAEDPKILTRGRAATRSRGGSPASQARSSDRASQARSSDRDTSFSDGGVELSSSMTRRLRASFDEDALPWNAEHNSVIARANRPRSR
jgi:hypothetical protein